MANNSYFLTRGPIFRKHLGKYRSVCILELANLRALPIFPLHCVEEIKKIYSGDESKEKF